MKKLISDGRLEIHTNTTISSRVFDDQRQVWKIETEPRVKIPEIDYIYFATGVMTDYQKIPYLQTLLKKHPIDGVNGLPCLTDDMAWNDDVPLYASGKLAGLRVGPGAANLVGARIGAERIAWSIQEYLSKDVHRDEDEADDLYQQGVGSRYDSLLESDGSEKE